MSERLDRYVALARSAKAAHRSGDLDAFVAGSAEIQTAARACRGELAAKIEAQLGPFDPRHLAAIREVPRERFVRADDLERAYDDAPLPLDDYGMATISAPHAYLLSFRLLELSPGDSMVELGSGSGYGAALASTIVGPSGQIRTIEIDVPLATRARHLLSDRPNVGVVLGDAMTTTADWGSATKVVCTFAVSVLPTAWLSALREGVVLVAPVGAREGDQRLVRIAREGGELRASDHGAVRYVKNRSFAN